MIPRLFKPLPLTEGATILLEEKERHYLIRVMRLTVGQSVILFNGRGEQWQARIDHAGPPLRLVLETALPVVRESPLAITLVQGLAKGPALEWVIQKGVELGMAAMIPLICERGRHDDGNPQRWGRIAAEAAEQCGRSLVPPIHPPTRWQNLADLLPDGPRLIFWEEEGGKSSLPSLLRTLEPPATITLIVGPEGGFSSQEVMTACQHLGCQKVGLGPRILRTETAAITALAALQLYWGDLA
ncbi:MAG: 16S rRNA (uracil(1498)-N(3))-methyltransferase [Magnetococcales bacterium]|nr:16S rRNA (uracil(1498)-N(3))-methyltransferase [Magnetococcales bacterium]NGZ26628.1 16S rRNA (uracil(1498)-N(3))-methyltransferase [Magnetococcales bacterium]